MSTLLSVHPSQYVPADDAAAVPLVELHDEGRTFALIAVDEADALAAALRPAAERPRGSHAIRYVRSSGSARSQSKGKPRQPQRAPVADLVRA